MTDHTEAPTTPTRAEREDAIWEAFARAVAPAEADFDRAIAPARAVRDAALEALREGGQ